MELNLAWLYPDLMSTYGDRGNVMILKERAHQHNLELKVIELTVGDSAKPLDEADLIFMGGAQDRQQTIVADDILQGKHELLRQAIEREVPGLFICGAYQFLGRYYQLPDGKKISGLGIFDLHTVSPADGAPRLIGNVWVEAKLFNEELELVGFENHGGRTQLGADLTALARVVKGFGNNGNDGGEGAVYRNAVGTYLHGPVLSKNPRLADLLIKRAIMVKYGEMLELQSLPMDYYAQAARRQLKQRMGL